MNSPIYKKGDPNQAGELGKAVNVDKSVSPPLGNEIQLLLEIIAGREEKIRSGIHKQRFQSICFRYDFHTSDVARTS